MSTVVFRPTSLIEALTILNREHAQPFAGGTDLMVQRRRYGSLPPRFDRPVLFLDAVGEITTVHDGAPGAQSPGQLDGESRALWIGAACPLSEVLKHGAVSPVLKRSIELLAAPGLRNRATLGGNIANASPAADALPPLYALGARIVIDSIAGDGIKRRVVPIGEFIRGPRETTLGPEEILTFVVIPRHDYSHSYYRKVGTRAANALTKVAFAGVADRDAAGRVTRFACAFGAVAPTVVRVPEIEADVVGHAASSLDAEAIADRYSAYIRPIDDQRSTAAYRAHTAHALCADFVATLSAED
ncbi:MAG: dehydrogenase [Spirochaetaceae bacterium]|nr:MAG: dehydrogenase [Spirochaetaceae bacterium]